MLIAGSAGALPAMLQILPALPRRFRGAVIVTQHRAPDPQSYLREILSWHAKLPVRPAVEGDVIRPGAVYVAAARDHLHINAHRAFQYRDGQRIRGVLAAANPLFESAATVFGPDVIAVVLSGGGTDATDGVQSVKQAGGKVIVQDRATSRIFGMGASAVGTGAVDAVLPVDEIAQEILRLTNGHPQPAST